MKRILLFIMAITFSLAPFAQKHSAQKKPVRKTVVTAKKKAATPARKTNSRGHVVRKTSKSAAPTRMEAIDRSEAVPIAVLNVNINDWKFVNDHFGDEESDRLIQTVAAILKNQAGPDYIIGRIDGDAFGVLIPMATEEEAESYMEAVQRACDTYEDRILAPSVAIGYVIKTNIEEKLEDRLSDAEYEMFNNKFEVKNAKGYQERLRKGLKQAK